MAPCRGLDAAEHPSRVSRPASLRGRPLSPCHLGIIYWGIPKGPVRIKMEAGSTTRRATVHLPRGGLKIESPNARKGACVIIRFPAGKSQGQFAAAMAQLRWTRAEPGPGSAARVKLGWLLLLASLRRDPARSASALHCLYCPFCFMRPELSRGLCILCHRHRECAQRLPPAPCLRDSH